MFIISIVFQQSTERAFFWSVGYVPVRGRELVSPAPKPSQNGGASSTSSGAPETEGGATEATSKEAES